MIKEYRKKAGLTQEEFSELFGIPLGTVKKWDAGSRQPSEWAEKLIIEKLESREVNFMEKEYSTYYESASNDIGASGYQILAREKYKRVIKKTVIKRYKNGLGEMEWQDDKGAIVAFHIGVLNPEWYPYIGEVVEVEGQ